MSANTMSRRQMLAASAAVLAGAALATPLASAEETTESRVYTASATGFSINGDVTANVTISTGGVIEAFEVVEDLETYNVGKVALEKVPERVIKNQTLGVDIVSGATLSSFAAKNIIEDCLAQAGFDPKDYQETVHEVYDGPAAENITTTVVIAGGGGAGMHTAIRLARAGVPVVIVEKRELMGGTASRPIYQLFGVESRAQKDDPNDPHHTADDFYHLYMDKDRGVSDPEMMRMRADGIHEIMDWIRFDMQVPLDVAEPGGYAVCMKPEIRKKGGVWGGIYTLHMQQELDRLGVDYRTQTRFVDLLEDENGKACGITVEAPNGTYNIYADKVVIATGAMCSNQELLEEFLPEWAGLPSNEIPTATGDGMVIGREHGVMLRGMDVDHLVVYHCCIKLGEHESFPVPVRASGGIIVNVEGRRFYNEQDDAFINLAYAAREQTDGRSFCICDQNYINNEGPFRGQVVADTLAELAEKLGIDPEGLEAEGQRYSELYDNGGVDEDFGRRSIQYPLRDAPFYGAEIWTALHGFDGGLAVDHRMQCLREDGSLYDGLYAEGGGVDFGMPTFSATGGKQFTAKLLAETLLEDLDW